MNSSIIGNIAGRGLEAMLPETLYDRCCCTELIVHTNAGITVKCSLSDMFGIELLFDLSIFIAVDKV
jgi:predicted AAA+ superfamily ATPase